MKYFISLLLFFFIFRVSYTQKTEIKKTKNEFYAQGNIALLGVAYSLNYERNLCSFTNVIKGNLNLKAYIGHAYVFFDEGPQASVMFNYVSGLKNHHFEVGAGVWTFRFWAEQYNGQRKKETLFLPDVQSGYKYKKPDGHFIFRTGIGYPHVFYIGLGTAF